MVSDNCSKEFIDWCNEKSIIFEGLELRSAGENAGNGVFTTRPFRSEETLISLPQSLMITAGSVADIPKYAQLLETSPSLLAPFDILTLFFCLEDVSNSEWAPYLNILPEHFDTPAYRGTRIEAGDLPMTVRNYWIQQQQELEEIYAKLVSLVPELSNQKFLWAWHVVNTRCIYVENPPHPKVDARDGDTLAVIPFVDMLNHDPAAKGVAMHDRYSRKYVVKANGFVPEGSQLYVCYGPHDNARLWMEYGFTMDNNPNLKVVITHDLLIALARKVGVSLTELHETAIHSASLPCNLYLSDEGPSWALRTNTRILLMDEKEISRWRDIIYEERERRRRQSSSEEDSDSESDTVSHPVLSEREVLERKTLKKMLQELRLGVESKSQQVSKDLVWMWQSQLGLIDTVIDNVDT